MLSLTEVEAMDSEQLRHRLSTVTEIEQYRIIFTLWTRDELDAADLQKIAPEPISKFEINFLFRESLWSTYLLQYRYFPHMSFNLDEELNKTVAELEIDDKGFSLIPFMDLYKLTWVNEEMAAVVYGKIREHPRILKAVQGYLTPKGLAVFKAKKILKTSDLPRNLVYIFPN